MIDILQFKKWQVLNSRKIATKKLNFLEDNEISIDKICNLFIYVLR